MGEDQCKNLFIAMPFKGEYNPLCSVIKEAASRSNLTAIRVDEDSFAGSIISHIVCSIQNSQFMVAVISEESGNVYYEIGLAHAQRKPVVMLTSDPKTLEFDLADHRAIIYNPENPRGILDELIRTLVAIQNENLSVEECLANRFGGNPQSQAGYLRGIEKITETLASDLNLTKPIEITHKIRLENRDIAIEAKDFFGKRVRAIVDINAVIRESKMM